MTIPPVASVIVRVRNEAQHIGAALRSVRSQSVPVELIVVDSGSTDGTLEIASGVADRLIEIPPHRFTYGRALNLGAAAAQAPVHVALSAHCALPHPNWIATAVAHYERPDVAATQGDARLPGGQPIEGVFFQDAGFFRAHPHWGLSNHASSWRASVWRTHHFDERLRYAEDKEWAWRVMQAGWVVACDPRLVVDMSHQWAAGLRSYFVRARNTGAAYRSFSPVATDDLRSILREWWLEVDHPTSSPMRTRFQPTRLVGLAGRWWGHLRG